MHIGIDARLTHYRRGGISTYITRLIAALESLDTANCYAVLHSRKAHTRLAQRFRHVPMWTPPHHRLERYALSAELLRLQLDVLHTTDFIPPLRGARHHVITIHDLTFLHYPDFLTAESRRYYNRQIAWAARRADHILTISQSSRRDIITMLDVPPDKVTVHLPGIDPDFRPLTSDAIIPVRRALALPDAYFLFVGTFEPRKNLIGLGRAYRTLLDRAPDAPPLVLAGSPGWNFDSTRTAIDSLRLGDRLLWRESIAQDAMPALYNGALALILPSFYEGFGIPPLEAMACGVVPLVSDRSSLPEVVGDVGICFPPDDHLALAEALERTWRDSAWRTAQSTAALTRARQFTWEKAAQIALSIYHQFDSVH
jgi:glycosyltransferase involved in cell wall biosynthesis